MLELLAQSSATGIISASLGAGGIGGIAYWLVRREIKKVVEHVDDRSQHVNPNNGYVTKSLCEERNGNLEKSLDEINRDVKTILREMPR